MSEPRSAERTWSYASSAARRPVSGSAPEPRPCVSSSPMWIFTGASERLSCCMSVLTATKSTWAMPASIIRLTALRPPPPTPTTRITARYDAASPPTLSRGAPSGIGWMKRLAGGSYGGSARAAGTGCGGAAGAAALRLTTGGAASTGAAAGTAKSWTCSTVSSSAASSRRLDGGAVGITCSTVSSSAASSRRGERRRCGPRAAASRIRVCWSSASAAGGNGSSTGSSSLRCRAERPRSRGTARRAAPHACSRASAPWSTSFASSRYASAAVPVGSYPSTELPFTGASA